ISTASRLVSRDGKRLPFKRAGSQRQVLFELVAKLLQDADRGQRRGVAERAQSLAENVERHVQRGVRIVGNALAAVEASEQRFEPSRPFAAGDAPAAGLMRVEPLDAQQG